MAINTITYTDKVALNVNADVPDINKVKADDMNEIKQVVNDNATAMGDVSTLKTNTTTDIVAGVNSIIDAEVYSTTEVKTNKVWIDGKPIYRKVLNSGDMSTAINHNISDIGWVVNLYGMVKNTNNEYTPIEFPNNNGLTYQISAFITSTQIKFNVGSGSSLSESYTIVEYTKTTD